MLSNLSMRVDFFAENVTNNLKFVLLILIVLKIRNIEKWLS